MSVDAAPAGWPGPKPRMVFFRINETNLPEFITGHFRDHVRCLEQFFDIEVISTNADYDEVVDRVQPDIALFESGVYARAGRAITNTHRHPTIPKVGFLDSDAYCLTRSVFLADMDDWGVDTFFSIGVSAGGYTPDIADRTFAWPNFADRSVFRTYPGGPTQSILLSGSRENNYPWRVRIDRLLRERFPVRALPHAGWFDRDKAAAMPSGEEYARSLGSALIVPTCGTIAGDLVRKHFEIPASGALLLTERTAAVEAAGFVDGENCVFADPSDVVDKVEFLLDNPEVLARISRAGQHLAHSRHSIENRDQIRQWFELGRAMPGGRILQPEIFGPLRVDGESDGPVSFIAPAGIDRDLLAAGHRHLASGEPGVAAERFAEVLNYHFEPEAALGLARSWIRLGRPAWARPILEYSTGVVLKPHGASHPDPVEWAWVARVALCESDLPRARALAEQYPRLRHPELDRIRAVLGVAADGASPSHEGHRSVHAGRGEEWDAWIADLVRDLTACGQDALARRAASLGDPSLHATRRTAVSARTTSAARAGRASLASRRFLERARRRAGREWSRVLGSDLTPDRMSAFQLLEGRQIDTVVLLVVPGPTADKVESLVDNDPSAVTLVRIGRTGPPVSGHDFAPRGLRSGIDPVLLRQVPEWGRTLVIASRIGASMLGTEHLVSTDLVIILGDDAAETGVEEFLGSGSGWRLASDALTTHVADALAQPRATVWERTAGDTGGDTVAAGRAPVSRTVNMPWAGGRT
ncbi:glycosyltransferase [Mycetocola sp. 2940]|uniref:glycosyltransferase family protein n=1 Tax=Mycetocola sp. 2940 TaxID=3156452 RepID=UPI003397FBCD